MSKFTCYMLLLCMLFTSCKKAIHSFDSSSSALEVTSTEFDYLSAKVKIDYKDGKNDVDATSNIRMKKDSIIWFSITPGLGIEASRGIITKDSLVIVDKIKKTYSIFTFEELSEKFKIDLDFSLVQAAIVGNLIFPYKEEQVTKEGNRFYYQQKVDRFIFDNFIGVQSKKIEKLKITDQSNNNSLQVEYANFQLVDEEIFPYEVHALFQFYDNNEGQNKETIVNIVYSKATLEKKPLRFPFNIPQKYVFK